MKHFSHILIIFTVLAPVYIHAEGLLLLIQRAREESLAWKAQEFQTQGIQLSGDVALGSILPSAAINASQQSGMSYSGAYSYDYNNSLVYVPSSSLPFQQTSLSAQLQIPLYVPSNYAAYRAAEEQGKIGEYDYQLFEEQYILSLCSQYFSILKSDKALTLSRDDLAMKEKFYADVMDQYDVGLVALTDLREAEAALDLARAREIQAIFQLEQSKNQLISMIQRTPESLDDIHTDITLDRLSENFEDIQTHPSILKARSALTQAQYQLNQAKSAYTPQLTGLASYSMSPVNQNISHTASSVSARIALSWQPPYGLATSSFIQQQSFLLQASQAQLAQVSLNHEIQLKIAHQQYDSLKRQIDAQKVAIQAASIYLSAVEASYEAGQRTASDVLDAQRSLTQQRQQLFNLIYDSLTLYIQIKMLHCYDIDQVLQEIDEFMTMSWRWNTSIE